MRSNTLTIEALEAFYEKIILSRAFLKRYLLFLDEEIIHAYMTRYFIGSFVFFFLVFYFKYA